MDQPNDSDSIKEADKDDEKENVTLTLIRRRPTDQQYKMIEDLFSKSLFDQAVPLLCNIRNVRYMESTEPTKIKKKIPCESTILTSHNSHRIPM